MRTYDFVIKIGQSKAEIIVSCARKPKLERTDSGAYTFSLPDVSVVTVHGKNLRIEEVEKI